MATPWSEPPSGGWLRPSLRRPPDLLELPLSQQVAEPPTSQPDPFLKALDESVLAVGPSVTVDESPREEEGSEDEEKEKKDKGCICRL